MSRRPVVVLDLDGVIIKSNFLKHGAMLAMFADYPDKWTAVGAYILGNGGVSRRDKLVEILETIIGVEATQERLAHYLEQYAKSLDASLAIAQLVEGVKEFVVRGDHAFYVSSTAPEEEVRDQLARNDLLRCFIRVYGSLTPKAIALAEISGLHVDENVVFFGDSLGDLDAARETGVAFVGVTNERDNFKGLDVVKLESFGSPDSVDQAIHAAIRMRSDASA
jgi:phosphoglycolate phosphatase-like HAD superfamily hydrolase